MVLVVGSVIFWYAVMMVDDTSGRAAMVDTITAGSFIFVSAPSVKHVKSAKDGSLNVGMRKQLCFYSPFWGSILNNAMICNR